MLFGIGVLWVPDRQSRFELKINLGYTPSVKRNPYRRFIFLQNYRFGGRWRTVGYKLNCLSCDSLKRLWHWPIPNTSIMSEARGVLYKPWPYTKCRQLAPCYSWYCNDKSHTTQTMIISRPISLWLQFYDTKALYIPECLLPCSSDSFVLP
jgi:hypothetical protein